MESIEPFAREPRFVYFSMEIALRPAISTYSACHHFECFASIVFPIDGLIDIDQKKRATVRAK